MALTDTLKANIYDSYDLKLEDLRNQLLGQIWPILNATLYLMNMIAINNI
jgi:hypothetical protein